MSSINRATISSDGGRPVPKWGKSLLLSVIATLAAGCAGLPTSGPLTSDVISDTEGNAPSHLAYNVVDVTAQVCDAVEQRPAPSFEDVFGTGNTAPRYAVHVGDTLSITVWEPGTSSLFAGMSNLASVLPTPRGTTLPPIVVEADGRISVPFAGRILVAGKTPAEIEAAIAANFAGKISNPQILVSVAASQENAVSVGGEVAHGARIPLSVGGMRVLDVIAAAGGVRIPVNESVIRVTRAGRTASVTYAELLADQKANVFMLPGDSLTVVRSPNTFTSFGAFGRAYQIAFEADSISLEEAVAKAGGLQDQRADPAGIFVFRYEPVSLAKPLGLTQVNGQDGGMIPVVYRFDMSEAGGYFLARRFKVQDKDVVYAANARLNEVQKFLNLLGSVLTPAATGASVSSAIH